MCDMKNTAPCIGAMHGWAWMPMLQLRRPPLPVSEVFADSGIQASIQAYALLRLRDFSLAGLFFIGSAIALVYARQK